MENLNRIARYSLAKTCKDDYLDWCKYLNQILQGNIRTRKNSKTGYSPFYSTFGVEPRLPGEMEGEVVLESTIAARVLELNVLSGLQASLECEPRSSSTNVFFSVGQMVMALSGSIRKKMINDKKKTRYIGPFQVLKMLEDQTYLCQDEYGQKGVFHVSRLVAFTPRLPSIR